MGTLFKVYLLQILGDNGNIYISTAVDAVCNLLVYSRWKVLATSNEYALVPSPE